MTKIVFETQYLRLVIGLDARVASLIDKATGAEHAAKPALPIARIKKDGKVYEATSAGESGGRLALRFGDSGLSAVVEVKQEKRYLVFEVVSVSDEKIDELAFVDIRLSSKGAKQPFAACALALDLRTNVPQLPGPTDHLLATCYPRFGLVGSKVAIIGCPKAELRSVMQEVVTAAPELPHSSVGGPWALDGPRNRESYLFNFGNLTESNVDQWIKLANDLGIKQIDFHGGGSFRFGDCRPNPTWYPNGRASFKAVIDKLHAAGILAGLHTYAFFIDKGAPWVTPIPDPRLGSDAAFTLAKPMGADDAEAVVTENTKDMSTTTGFFVQNSIILRIDQELVTFAGLSKELPYAFTGLKRGAFGTKVSEHAAGARAYHLKECFGYLAPDADSTLFTDVAAATADFYNECGFDMIYLDALDGEGILGGWQNGWHYGSAFVFELEKRLKKPAIMEMSTFHHHLWYVRSRMGAWDHPVRSYKRFIDLHCRSNSNCDAMFLPAHLGWWSMISSDVPWREPTFADDIEYLLAKCAGHDCGLSPQGFTPESWAGSYNLRRLGGIIKRWEDLRNAGFFTEKMKAMLREPNRDYTLVEEKGKPRLREIQYAKHRVEGLNSPTSAWTTANRFGAQPVRLRIEALNSVTPYDAPENATVIDFADPAALTDREFAPGVKARLVSSSDQVKSGAVSGCYTATWTPLEPAKSDRADSFSVKEHAQREIEGGVARWSKIGAAYPSELNLGGKGALGVWVYGDGQGEMLNFQLRSPQHLSTGIFDYYVTVDFKGWRYFELVEPEGERTEDHVWPYGGNSYALYRELVNFERIAALSVWYNDLPKGREVKCYLSPIKALPLQKVKLANPSVTIGGRTITFPVELETSSYIEYNSVSDCKLYAADGNLVGDIKPQGTAPELKAGKNEVEFACEPPAGGVSARANVTVIGVGKEL